MSGYKHDGDYTDRVQHGPTRCLIDPEKLAKIWKRIVRQYRTNYAPLAYGTTCDTSIAVGGTGSPAAYLVGQSEPRDTGAGVLEVEEEWAEIPPPRNTIEPHVHAYQFRITDAGTESVSTTIAELPLAVAADVSYSYGILPFDHEPGDTLPTELEIHRAFRYVQLGEVLTHIGTPPATTDTTMLSVDSILEPWKKPIWQRREVRVPIYAPTE